MDSKTTPVFTTPDTFNRFPLFGLIQIDLLALMGRYHSQFLYTTTFHELTFHPLQAELQNSLLDHCRFEPISPSTDLWIMTWFQIALAASHILHSHADPTTNYTQFPPDDIPTFQRDSPAAPLASRRDVTTLTLPVPKSPH